jgi:putative CocE/NonD family hydrolase
MTQAALRRIFNWALVGVAPVDDDASGETLDLALKAHQNNFNLHHGAVHITFRDDSPPNAPVEGETSDAFSPHTYVDRVRASGAAVLGYSGWFDGGYANGAVKRHRALDDTGQSSLLIGPWTHGGALDLDPDGPRRKARFDHAAELLRFFDRHLCPERASEASVAPVRFFVMGEGRWRSSRSWPPAGTRSVSLHFARDRKLSRSPVTSGVERHEVDLASRAGQRSRWRTLLCPWLHADGAGRTGRHLVYETDPLDEDLVLLGNPVLVVSLATSVPDAAIIVYLEDVDERGAARLFTEGALRTVHATKLVGETEGAPRVEASYARLAALRITPGDVATFAVELMPTAMRVRRRHRLRIVLGGADLDHFTTPPAAGPVEWTVHLAGSRLVLPVGPAS